jgi:hypothetical protein
MAMGILLCYVMGRSMEWNWLSLAACIFLVPFTLGLYFIPESPSWLVYNDEEDLAFKSMVLIRGEEYDATVEIRRIKERLEQHGNDLHALLNETDDDHMAAVVVVQDSHRHENHFPTQTASFHCSCFTRRVTSDCRHIVPGHAHGATGNAPHVNVTQPFTFRDLLAPSALYPFAVILVLMFLLQFSGQGAVTFYTAFIFEEAKCSMAPNDCALIIGVTYFLSSILGLVLKKHVGRRVLLLLSELGMAMALTAMGIYFYILQIKVEPPSPSDTSFTLSLFLVLAGFLFY